MKQWSRKVLACALLFILSADVCLAATAERLVKQYTFTTHTRNFAYDAPKTIRTQGATYKLVNIQRYEIKSEKRRIEKQVSYRDLTKRQVPQERAFTVDGKRQQLTLEKASLRYSKIKGQRKVKYRHYTKPPQIPKAVYFSIGKKREKREVLGTLQRTDKDQTTKRVPFSVRGKFTGNAGCEYYLDGRPLALDQATPTWRGFETAIKAKLGLPKTCIITSGKWDGGYQTVGTTTVRYATFHGIRDRPFYNYTAWYTYPAYHAVATYTNNVPEGAQSYTVCAYAVYVKNRLPLWLTVGLGLLILSVFAVGILYLIGKKRSEKNENSH